MALKPDREVRATDISFFCDMTGERGVVVYHLAQGSGAAMDQAEATCQIPTNQMGIPSTSGLTPLGVLLCDVVNKDLTTTHLNPHKEEVQVGSKVTILTNGWIVTDQIQAGQSPTVGQLAYGAPSGKFTNVNNSGHPLVGKFLSGKNEDGYCKVAVNLP
jgi:hypothetical protein